MDENGKERIGDYELLSLIGDGAQGRVYRARCVADTLPYVRQDEEVALKVVRITGDCPLIDPRLVDAVIGLFEEKCVDYASNTMPPTYPDGLDTEVFTFEALEIAWSQAKDPRLREHVTPYIRESRQFARINLAYETDNSAERWTVDEPEDFEVIRNVFEHFSPRGDFSWLEVLALRQERLELFTANRHLVRNEGQYLGTGQKLWKRAKRVIPGGNMLLSKRAEMFLPERWPARTEPRSSGVGTATSTVDDVRHFVRPELLSCTLTPSREGWVTVHALPHDHRPVREQHGHRGAA